MDEETKRKALRILEDYGAINIEAEFDGAHSIEHRLVHLIEGISDAEKVQVSEEAIALGELESGATLEDFIDWLVRELLIECGAGDWIHDEGGFGDVTIIPSEHYIFVDFNYRKIASVHSGFNLSLTDCKREPPIPMLDKAVWMAWAEKLADEDPKRALILLSLDQWP